MYADAAGLVMRDLVRLRWLGYVINLEAAVVIAALGLRLDLSDVGFRHSHPARKLGMRRLASGRGGEFAVHTRQVIGAAADGCGIALMIDDHDVAYDTRFVAV